MAMPSCPSSSGSNITMAKLMIPGQSYDYESFATAARNELCRAFIINGNAALSAAAVHGHAVVVAARNVAAAAETTFGES